MRSILDPLPRFLSTRGLVLVVGMLVLGTGISVHEFLESARPPVRHGSASTVRSERASPPESGARRATDAWGARGIRRFTEAPAPQDSIPSSATPAPASAPNPPAPSVWEPSEPHPGR